MMDQKRKTNWRLKVGTVRRNLTGIRIHKGKPMFTGQVLLPAVKVMDPANFPFYYPIIPEFVDDKLDDSVRYYGYTDLDMTLDSIQAGIDPLLLGGERKVYTNRCEVKEDLVKFMDENQGMTVGALALAVPELGKVLAVTQLVFDNLKSQGHQPTVFFTGLKGTRLLWFHQSMYRSTMWNRTRDGGDSGGQVVLNSIDDPIVIKALYGVDFDKSVYGNGKGLKPDCLPHPFSGHVPTDIAPDGNWDDSQVCVIKGDVDPKLKSKILSFWRTVWKNVKTTYPPLEVSKTGYKGSRRPRKDDGKPPPKKRRKKPLGPTANEKKVEMIINMAIANRPFISKITRTCGNRFLVNLGASHKFCHIKGDDHSSNKTFFMVDTYRGTCVQRCHSAACEHGRALLWPLRQDELSDSVIVLKTSFGDGQQGLAEVAQYLIQEDVRVIGDRGDVAVWNEGNCLWEVKKESAGRQILQTRLRCVIDETKREWEADRQDRLLVAESAEEIKEIEEEVNPWASCVKNNLKASQVASLWSICAATMQDDKFREKLNNEHDLLPIMDKKCVNLQTGQVFDRTRDHLFSIEAPIRYDEDMLNMETPNADKFFASIMCDDKEMVTYMRRQLGYSLTGCVRSRCFFIWHGVGRNGKGVTSKIMRSIMGPFYAQLSQDVLIACDRRSSAGGATPHLMKLMYARMGMLSETAVGDKFNESFLKSWCGDAEKIQARALYTMPVDIDPRAKLFIQTNHLPEVSNGKDIEDRLKSVPFKARFSSKPIGDELPSDPAFIDSLLTTHLTECFVWILKGAMEWYATGGDLGEAKVAMDASAEYMADNDLVQQWIDQECEVREDYKQKRSELCQSFKDWANVEGKTIVGGNQGFYKKLKAKGFHWVASGSRRVSGMRLINHEHDDVLV